LPQKLIAARRQNRDVQRFKGLRVVNASDRCKAAIARGQDLLACRVVRIDRGFGRRERLEQLANGSKIALKGRIRIALVTPTDDLLVNHTPLTSIDDARSDLAHLDHVAREQSANSLSQHCPADTELGGEYILWRQQLVRIATRHDRSGEQVEANFNART
jgi:hypothetical protein